MVFIMNDKDFFYNIKKIQENNMYQQKKYLESINESIEMQKRQFSPIYNLIKDSKIEKSQMGDFIQTPYLDGFHSNYAYDAYKKNRESVQDSIKKLFPDNNVYLQNVKSLNESLQKMNSPTPFDILYDKTIAEEDYWTIYEELNNIDWKDTISDSIIPSIGDLQIDFVTKNPEIFSLRLSEHVEECSELKSVFTKAFLDEITKEWWIFPRFSLDDYKELYDDFIQTGELDIDVLFDYYIKPEYIYNLLDDWNFEDENRQKVIMQAIDNYYVGNYEISVVTLLLQVEGLLRDKFRLKTRHVGKLREKLENELKNLLKTSENLDFWDIFLIQSNIDYIWMILNPLSDEVDFIEDEYEINRNISAHTGKVEANQKIAIRLILIIDTLMFLLDLID